jgi:hypothetical protein
VSIIAAQSSNSADLEGTITDSAGAAIAGRPSDGHEHGNSCYARLRDELVQDFYHLPALPAGEYDLQVSKDGFASVERRGLALRAGQLATIDVELPVASQPTPSYSAAYVLAG